MTTPSVPGASASTPAAPGASLPPIPDEAWAVVRRLDIGMQYPDPVEVLEAAWPALYRAALRHAATTIFDPDDTEGAHTAAWALRDEVDRVARATEATP